MRHTQFGIGVMDNLCADVNLGLYFMREREVVQLKLNSDKSLLEVDFGDVKKMNYACLVDGR